MKKFVICILREKVTTTRDCYLWKTLNVWLQMRICYLQVIQSPSYSHLPRRRIPYDPFGWPLEQLSHSYASGRGTCN